MKKLLIMLMVVAMAFLLVGCLGTTPPIDPEDPDEPGIKTDTPYITGAGEVDILATTTQYLTEDTASNFKVEGVGVSGAIIKLYIGDEYAGIGYTSEGAFRGIGITGITLTEGAKKFYVTATLPGLAESDASTEYAFTYDETAPKIASVAGDSGDDYITVTFDEPVNADNVEDAKWLYSPGEEDAYKIPPNLVANKVIAPSATTARLYVDADLQTGDFLSVLCDDSVTDLAGNPITPVTVLGRVVK
ncbi:hypothetical protein ES708_31455 [subsurface metagenome]